MKKQKAVGARLARRSSVRPEMVLLARRWSCWLRPDALCGALSGRGGARSPRASLPLEHL